MIIFKRVRESKNFVIYTAQSLNEIAEFNSKIYVVKGSELSKHDTLILDGMNDV